MCREVFKGMELINDVLSYHHAIYTFMDRHVQVVQEDGMLRTRPAFGLARDAGGQELCNSQEYGEPGFWMYPNDRPLAPNVRLCLMPMTHILQQHG